VALIVRLRGDRPPVLDTFVAELLLATARVFQLLRLPPLSAEPEAGALEETASGSAAPGRGLVLPPLLRCFQLRMLPPLSAAEDDEPSDGAPSCEGPRGAAGVALDFQLRKLPPPLPSLEGVASGASRVGMEV
jgi:hypothetical protein